MRCVINSRLLAFLALTWSVTMVTAMTDPRGVTAPTGIAWEESFDSALARAAAEGRPILIYLTMPNCNICRHLEATTLADPAVRQRLRDWVCVRLDVTVDRELAARLGAEGTPTLVTLGSDGHFQNRITGYLAPYEFLTALTSGAAGRGGQDQTEERQSREALDSVHKGPVPAGRWPVILQALRYAPGRADLIAAVLAVEPFPRADLVAALTDSQLAVRLGALEVLEQAAGDDFAFDPWEGAPETNAPPAAALARWQAWAASPNVVLAARFSSLTREQVGARLLDLLSGDRDRVQRARRQLIDGGAAVAEPAAEFLARHADLPVGLADRIREVRYAALLPARPGFDPAVQAQRLVFGNLDVQLQALRDVRVQKAAALPVALDFLRHPNPLVRETAVDTLIAVARRDSVPALRDLLTRESNREVIVAVARGLAGVRGKGASDVLAGLLDRDDEDVVITALRSLAKNEAGAPVSAVCKRLTDPRWRVRVAALQAVSELRPHEAADPVERLVDDPDAFVRFTAIVTLSKVCPVDRAVKRLEKAFLASDEYKAPVLAAFGAMERALPASFINASTGKTAEVLLPMLEALSKCGKHGVPLATALAGHPDGDVACAALGVLARNSVKSANAPLVEALRRGSRGQAIIVLEALQEEAGEESHSSHSSNDSDFDDVLSELSATRSSGASGAGTEGPSPVADLLDAFLAPDKAAPAATPAKPAPPPPGLTDLFDAFDATQTVAGAEASGAVPAMARPAAPTASARDLAEAVRACRGRFPSDRAVQNAALVALVRLGDTNAVTEIAGALDGLSDEYRATVASALKGASSPEELALLRRLLRDADSTTRKAAAARLGSQAETADWCNALFEEVARDGSPLSLEEAFESVLRSDFKKVAALANVRQWADRFFEKPPRPALKVLAVVLYEKLNRRQEAGRLTPLIATPDPLLRRAAYRTLGKLDMGNRGPLLQQAATDAVEDVRAVVPGLLGTGSGAWVHKFDDKESLSTWQWSPDDRRLKESERLALRRLTADPVPELRAESLIALMSVGEPFEPTDLMSALEQCRDSTGMSRRAADVLESNYEKLSGRYAALLPLLDAGRISDDRRESILKRLTGPAGASAGQTVVLRENVAAPTATVTGAVAVAVAPVATNVLRVIFFRETGCEDCETARAFLKALADAFPELRIEEHEMGAEGSLALNKALAEKFHMPDRQRGRTPTVVAAAGTLVGNEITFDSLADLLARSLGAPW